MMSAEKIRTEGGVEEAIERKTKKPPLFKVLLLNDDYTTMDFVIEILMDVFHKSRTAATQVMLHVHRKGMGVCGVYTREIAETKVARVNDYSRSHHHPLLCAMEEA